MASQGADRLGERGDGVPPLEPLQLHLPLLADSRPLADVTVHLRRRGRRLDGHAKEGGADPAWITKVISFIVG